jgi:TRAP-type C4-dicarboxylate transport system permease small subunit
MRKVLYHIEKANLWIINIAKYILGLIITVQVIIVFIAVVSRYCLNRPLYWSDELAAFLLVYITFIGSYIATSKDKLAKIDILSSHLGSLKKFVDASGRLITLIIVGAVCWYGFRLMFSRTIMLQKSPSMRWPMITVFAVLPVTMLLVFISGLVDLVRVFVPRNEDEALPEDKILDRRGD